MGHPDIYEDDGESIYVSLSAEVTAIAGPDDEGLAGVRAPSRAPDSPLPPAAAPHDTKGEE
jgi:hypothetical protein